MPYCHGIPALSLPPVARNSANPRKPPIFRLPRPALVARGGPQGRSPVLGAVVLGAVELQLELPPLQVHRDRHASGADGLLTSLLDRLTYVLRRRFDGDHFPIALVPELESECRLGDSELPWRTAARARKVRVARACDKAA